ncbi:exodeoxyribonuclease V subunit beta [Pasteurellaceae bacterium Macca]|nr:exodeoxyribonuclease V subunit beta [Pasteurellaceae bacterium Macca]
MKRLNALSLPLDQSSLIEASAGTGKTYTIANLFLRLLLGVNCKALTVEQILVVTFTKAATQELRDRIRKRILYAIERFHAYQSGDVEDDFLFELYQGVQDNLPQALLRLSIAEKEIDLASIFTIHSFCQKMLFQFAFNSGVRFDIDLQADESELLTQLAQETWRELFYPMNLADARLVSELLGTPQNALSEVQGYLYGVPPELSEAQQWINQPLGGFINQLKDFIGEVKAYWLAHQTQIHDTLNEEINKEYKKGVKKSLNRRIYQNKRLQTWINEVENWANSEALHLPEHFARFTQEMIEASAEEGAEILTHPHFAKNQQFLTAYQTQFEGKTKSLLLYQFLTHLKGKLAEHKAEHKEKSFDDILQVLRQGVTHPERGETLCAQIRQLYPFAMIDEFQDTDEEQYTIFRHIFMPEQGQSQGFMMIGDPKQSIYKFRRADIFTYLNAANTVTEKATLDTNYRTLAPLVESTNQLFSFPTASTQSPFLHAGIQYQPVNTHDKGAVLVGEQSCHYYLQDDLSDKDIAKHCAYLIQQQLKKAEEGKLALQKDQKKRPLAPQDIAVLVRSHNQASLIREALSECGIQSVFFSEKSSVFETQEAQDLCFILKACLNPEHPRTLLSALGTALWGLNAKEIYHLKHDENHWDYWVERFNHYQQIWHYQGVLPMLHHIFLQGGIIERINAQENAERRMTDILHLAELLQGEMPNVENESTLVRWYEQQLQKSNGRSEEQTLRLESEAGLVKVVTIHGSKGLEYPVVWLPFIGKASQERTSQGMVIYRDKQDKPCWHFGKSNDEVKAQLNQEEFAEDLRLLYVAMTRASYQQNAILPRQFGKAWNAVSYLLTNGEIGLGGSAPDVDTATLLTQKGIECEYTKLADLPPKDPWRPAQHTKEALQAREFQGKITLNGQITSFTGLIAQHERLHSATASTNTYLDNARDDDRQTMMTEQLEEQAQLRTPYQFPQGTKVGNVLHQFFEHWDFQNALEVSQVQHLCEQLNLDECWVEPITQWFEQICQTPLYDGGFCLGDVTRDKRLNEWQFYLRLENEKALPTLNKLLKKHTTLAAKLPDLQLSQLNGFIRGFVDLIVQIEGKFYLLDYKSNFLGDRPQDYTDENLRKTMGQYRYDLQYLLYTLALHRYLEQRLGEDYDYETHFGGVAYLFLRGMNGNAGSGVFFDKPNAELIEEMDRLFG